MKANQWPLTVLLLSAAIFQLPAQQNESRIDWSKLPDQEKDATPKPVAILTTDTFDATTVDPSTVCFGDADDPAQRDCTEAHGTGHIEDVNGDGRPDLLLHYETSQTGIELGDTQACLTGETFDGVEVEGCDAITTH